MNTNDVVNHFKHIANKTRRDCFVLTQCQPNEKEVGYWKTGKGKEPTSFVLELAPFTDLALGQGWLTLICNRASTCTTNIQDSKPEISGFESLSAQPVYSYPNLEEEWDEIAPMGYDDWLQSASPTDREAGLNSLRNYESFYQKNLPFHQTSRKVYTVVGGWGLYIFENEWSEYPRSRPVLFTLANTEPYCSVRQTLNGNLICKSIIT